MKNTLVICILLCILAGASAFGDTVELPLNCAGTYTVDTPYWTSNFDLGVTFSEISHVYIDWSGEITANLATFLNGPIGLVPDSGLLSAEIGTYPQCQIADVFGGESTYPAPEPFDAQSEFSRMYGTGTWVNLLDGRETITIFYDLPILDGSYVEYGSAVLNNSTLIIEGTIIPEPATIILLGLGIVSVLRQKGRNLRK